MNNQNLGYFSHQSIISSERKAVEYSFISITHSEIIITTKRPVHSPTPWEINVDLKKIKQASFLIVSAINGKIEKNSYEEVLHCLELGIPVKEIYSVGRCYKFRKVIGLELVFENNPEWYAILKTVPLINSLV